MDLGHSVRLVLLEMHKFPWFAYLLFSIYKALYASKQQRAVGNNLKTVKVLQ